MIDPIAIGAILSIIGGCALLGALLGLGVADPEAPVPSGLLPAADAAFIGGVTLLGGWEHIDGFILPLFIPMVLFGEYAAWWQGGDWWRST